MACLPSSFFLARVSSSFGQTVGGQLGDFARERLSHQFHLERVRAHVKSKHARSQPDHLRRADEIRQPEFLADADEKPRAEVAAGLVDEFERVAVRAADRGAGVADHQDRLFFPRIFRACAIPPSASGCGGIDSASFANWHPAKRLSTCARTVSASTLPNTASTPFLRHEVLLAESIQSGPVELGHRSPPNPTCARHTGAGRTSATARGCARRWSCARPRP